MQRVPASVSGPCDASMCPAGGKRCSCLMLPGTINRNRNRAPARAAPPPPAGCAAGLFGPCGPVWGAQRSKVTCMLACGRWPLIDDCDCDCEIEIAHCTNCTTPARNSKFLPRPQYLLPLKA